MELSTLSAPESLMKEKYIAKLQQQREKEQLMAWRKGIHGLGIEEAPDFVKCDKDAALAIVKADSYAFRHIHDSLKNDREIFLTALAHSPPNSYDLLKYAHASLKKDKEVVLAAIEKDGRSFEFAHKCVQSDKDFVILVMKRNGALLRFAHDTLRSDKDVVIAAVQQDSRSFQFAHVLLKSDKDVVLAAMKQFSRESHRKNKESSSTDNESTHSATKRDDDLKVANIIAALKQENQNVPFAPELDEKDKEVVLAALKQDNPNVQFALEPHKKDKETVLAAMKVDGAALGYSNESLGENENFVLVVMKQSGNESITKI
mmetsp:Transcript_9969/g.12573  ORF Transcript_9969/g.12573 Transcript_9969/m.12573 type:complete len:317 (+) Transcript_9969:105-1055(+)